MKITDITCRNITSSLREINFFSQNSLVFSIFLSHGYPLAYHNIVAGERRQISERFNKDFQHHGWNINLLSEENEKLIEREVFLKKYKALLNKLKFGD